MNKNLKKMIAVTLTLSALSAVIPATNSNLINIKAYAASGELTSIKLKTSSGNTIKTYDYDDYKSKNEVDDDELDNGETYYAKTSSTKIKVDTKGVSSSYIRIFKSKSSSAKGVKPSNSIELSKDSTTTLTVRTYDDDPGTVKYSDDSYTSQYIIKVKCTANSSDDSEENDDVYLKSLSLSDGDFNFSKTTSNYDINVAESIDEVTVTAKPDCDSDEYDDYKVTIDGSTVDESDKFKKSVSLNKGKNEIKITVEDDDENERTYKLNITRGNASTATNSNNGTSSNNNSNTNTTVAVKTNQWVIVNGQWQYNDSLGNPVKNAWVNDYYLKADGYMATGWQYINSHWYYFNPNVGGPLGSMYVNRWAQSASGAWYYLGSNGIMVTNTVINGYKIGPDGAWIV